MKRILFLLGCLFLPYSGYAVTGAWTTPYGTFGLPFSLTEVVTGYDFRYKEFIGGASIPLYQTPKAIAAVHLGAVATTNTQSANTQPYVDAGIDILRFVPQVSQTYPNLHLNGFGRWAADHGGIGYGGTFSWSFATP